MYDIIENAKVIESDIEEMKASVIKSIVIQYMIHSKPL